MTFTEEQWRKRQENLRAVCDAQAAVLDRVRALLPIPPGWRDDIYGPAIISRAALAEALGPAPAQADPWEPTPDEKRTSDAILSELSTPPKGPFPRPLAPAQAENPVPMQLDCPKCGLHHVDTLDPVTGVDWAVRLHKTHLCLGCGNLFKPAEFATVGMPAPAQAEPDWYKTNLELALVKLKAAETKSDVDYQEWRKSDAALQAAEARCAESEKQVLKLREILAGRENDWSETKARCAELEHERNALAKTAGSESARADRELARCAKLERSVDDLHKAEARCAELDALNDRLKKALDEARGEY